MRTAGRTVARCPPGAPASVVPEQDAMTSKPLNPARRLVAHRGYPQRFPENTLPSIRAALAAGACYVEVDVQLSRDGEPVLFHDRALQRLCDVPGAVHEFSWAELQQLRVRDRARFGGRFTDISIPHLRELVELLHGQAAVTAFIEIKRISLEQFGIEQVVNTVLAELAPLRQHSVIISYSLPALQAVRAASDWPLGVVLEDWSQRQHAAVQALQADYLFCAIEDLPAEPLPAQTGVQWVAFETVEPQVARQLWQRGIDLVETFAIGEMLEALQAKEDACSED